MGCIINYAAKKFKDIIVGLEKECWEGSERMFKTKTEPKLKQQCRCMQAQGIGGRAQSIIQTSESKGVSGT